LIALINQRPSHLASTQKVERLFGSVDAQKRTTIQKPSLASSLFKTTGFQFVFRRPGGSCEVARPDPIPNSAVKRFSANGTLSQDTGE
jgi:hypothetical protein